MCSSGAEPMRLEWNSKGEEKRSREERSKGIDQTSRVAQNKKKGRKRHGIWIRKHVQNESEIDFHR